MNKYGARKTTIDNVTFDSKKESEMYLVLKSRQQAGQIEKLKLQPKFELQGKFENSEGDKHRAITYSADFSFYDKVRKRFRVIDCKGFKTQIYRMKQKMFDHIMRDRGIYLEENI